MQAKIARDSEKADKEHDRFQLARAREAQTATSQLENVRVQLKDAINPISSHIAAYTRGKTRLDRELGFTGLQLWRWLDYAEHVTVLGGMDQQELQVSAMQRVVWRYLPQELATLQEDSVRRLR